MAMVIAVFGTGATVESGEGQEDHPPADLCEGHVHRHHGGEFARLAHAVYAPKHWQTPRRLARRQGDVLLHKRHCAATQKVRDKMQRIQRQQKRTLYRYRLYRRIAPYRSTIGDGPPRPGDHRYYAIPWYVVCGESGGDFRVNADGAYQIIPSTWAAFGGTQFASLAGYATPLQQHIIAARAWGKTPWYGAC